MTPEEKAAADKAAAEKKAAEDKAAAIADKKTADALKMDVMPSAGGIGGPEPNSAEARCPLPGDKTAVDKAAMGKTSKATDKK